MSRTKHDRFAKDALELWLDPLGSVRAAEPISGETRVADLVFREAHERPSIRRELGLLGRIARGTVVFEAFRNSPTVGDIRGCLTKLFDLHAAALRKARRERRARSTVPLPALWIIAPSLSSSLLRQLSARPAPRLPRGIYSLGSALGAHLVSCRHLPDRTDTLWLRVLGRGRVQGRAIDEVARHPNDVARATFSLLVAWAAGDEDPTMKLAEVERKYARLERDLLARGRAEGKAEGKAEGEAKGKAEAVLAVLEARGVHVTRSARARVVRCTDRRQLDRWLTRAPFVDRAVGLFE